MKKINQIEYIVKGFSNKNRINIILILEKNPEISVKKIARKTKMSFNSTSAHLLKMMASGIVMKRNHGKEVLHTLTKKGKTIYCFLVTI